MSDKKFYWLKLKKDFFKRHDIRIIEGMPDGVQISHFYLKLMLESVDHDGELRFNESIPYTPDMLAVITDTDLSIVNKSLEVLETFKLVQKDDTGTIILPKVIGMIDSASDTDAARRQRRCRERKKQECDEMSQQALQNVTTSVTKDNESKSKSKSKSKSTSKSTRYIFVPPTLQDVIAYCQERNNSVDAKRFFDYYNANDWKDSKGNQVRNWKQKLITWENKDARVAVNPQPIPKKEYGLDYNAILAQARENDRKAAEGK